jgi:hypothetical protein
MGGGLDAHGGSAAAQRIAAPPNCSTLTENKGRPGGAVRDMRHKEKDCAQCVEKEQNDCTFLNCTCNQGKDF